MKMMRVGTFKDFFHPSLARVRSYSLIVLSSIERKRYTRVNES